MAYQTKIAKGMERVRVNRIVTIHGMLGGEVFHRAAEGELKGASHFIDIPLFHPQQIVEEVENKVVLDLAKTQFGFNRLIPALIDFDIGQQGGAQ